MIDIVANASVGELVLIWAEDCNKCFATIDIVLQANARLTNVGISLHKQGQVLDHVRQQTESFADEPPPDVSDEIPVLDSLLTEETDSERALALLKRRKRLESILNKLSYLVERKNDLKPLQQTLRLQQKRLAHSWEEVMML